MALPTCSRNDKWQPRVHVAACRSLKRVYWSLPVTCNPPTPGATLLRGHSSVSAGTCSQCCAPAMPPVRTFSSRRNHPWSLVQPLANPVSLDLHVLDSSHEWNPTAHGLFSRLLSLTCIFRVHPCYSACSFHGCVVSPLCGRLTFRLFPLFGCCE